VVKSHGHDQTKGQRKGLWAEASFCLEFCFLLVKQKGKRSKKLSEIM
jgi:hypothetical protein